jgi:hypothetical protein
VILFKKTPLRFEGQDYEIRMLYDNETINVVAFLGNHPANGYRHIVKIPKKCDAKKVLEKHALAELIEVCKGEIIEKRWETLSKVISESAIDEYP